MSSFLMFVVALGQLPRAIVGVLGLAVILLIVFGQL